MITKPVCKIFNVTGVYATEDKTLEEAVGLASNGDLIVLKDGKTIDPATTVLSSAKNVEIFQKLGTNKVQKAPGAKSLRYDDIFNINIKKSQEYKPFYAEISGYKYCCDGEYGLKFEVINDELRQQMFPNGYTESYILPASECCAACGNNESEDDNQITLGLYKAIIANKRSMLTPYMVVKTAGHTTTATGSKSAGATVTETDVQNMITDNETEKSETTPVYWETCLVVTVAETGENFYGQYNFKYVKQRATQMFVSPISNMKCTGVIKTNVANADNYSNAIKVGGNTVADFQLAQTDGYDLRQVEYEYMGWMGKSPYRLSDVTLTEFGHEYTFDKDKTYDVFSISYEQQSDAAWGHFEHPLNLVLAVDSTDANGTALKIYKFLQGNTSAAAIKDENINLK